MNEHKRVVRIVVFEGPADRVDAQVAGSLPDGYRIGNGSVRISTLTLDSVAAPALLADTELLGTDEAIADRLARLPHANFGDYASIGDLRGGPPK